MMSQQIYNRYDNFPQNGHINQHVLLMKKCKQIDTTVQTVFGTVVAADLNLESSDGDEQ